VVGLEAARAIGVGYAHACAIDKLGRAWCWGNNQGGQLGHPATDEWQEPAVVPGLEGIAFSQIGGGSGHTCGRSEAGDVYCWGLNDQGQCGVEPSGSQVITPNKTPVVGEVRQLESISSHNCVATTSEPGVSCWGYNQHGAMAEDPNTLSRTHQPVRIVLPGDVTVLKLGLGFGSVFAVTSDRLYAWGRNHRGQLGVGEGTAEDVLVPMPVLLGDPADPSELEDALGVSSGNGSHHCAQLENAQSAGQPFVCWGHNDHGDSTVGEPTDRFYTAQPSSRIPADAEDLIHGDHHTCWIAPDETNLRQVYCVGRHDVVGDGTASRFDDLLIEARTEPTRLTKWQR
jgi:alpha-tubulin suppressor-like RCC1 family protein